MTADYYYLAKTPAGLRQYSSPSRRPPPRNAVSWTRVGMERWYEPGLWTDPDEDETPNNMEAT